VSGPRAWQAALGRKARPVLSVHPGRPPVRSHAEPRRRSPTPGCAKVNPPAPARPLRVALGSPHPDLSGRLADLIRQAGHEIAIETANPFELMEVCFEKGADIAVVDQDLLRVRGSEIAAILRDLRQPVPSVVLHRGELADADLLALDPTRPGFDSAFTNVLSELARDHRSGGPSRRAG